MRFLLNKMYFYRALNVSAIHVEWVLAIRCWFIYDRDYNKPQCSMTLFYLYFPICRAEAPLYILSDLPQNK